MKKIIIMTTQVWMYHKLGILQIRKMVNSENEY